MFQHTDLPKSATQSNQENQWYEYLPYLLTITMIALIGGGYWYIRNYLITGTPLYPVGITILGKTLFPGVSVSEAIWENSNTLSQFKDLSPVVRIFFDWAQGFKAWPLTPSKDTTAATQD